MYLARPTRGYTAKPLTKDAKTLAQVLGGHSDRNIHFAELLSLLERLGFELRVRGSHHILVREGIEEIINLQPKGALVKPYQVKQVRDLILQYHLGEDLDA